MQVFSWHHYLDFIVIFGNLEFKFYNFRQTEKSKRKCIDRLNNVHQKIDSVDADGWNIYFGVI